MRLLMRAEMILKNRLKEERINFGISQKELAQLVVGYQGRLLTQ